MRYDWNEQIKSSDSTREFFEEIDRRHFSDAASYCPPRERPFDALVPFDRLSQCDVLEIGVGQGSHAQLIAPRCRRYTGIDLTEYAVRSTRRRFELFGLPGQILQMDGERMSFPDSSFDFIWSWGVIHHSANTEQVLREMHRVLRPGGTAVTMVYHRSWLYYYVFNGLFKGVLRGDLIRTRSLHRVAQLNTDGALARMYSRREWRALAGKHFTVDKVEITGQKSELCPLPAGRFKATVMAFIPDSLCRLILGRWHQGSFLITSLTKKP